MFQGSIPQDVRKMIHEHIRAWDCKDVYVACSGNFTIERMLAAEGRFRIHGNDISIYSASLGRYLAGQPVRLEVADDFREEFGYLTPFLQTPADAVASLMLLTSVAPGIGKTNPYYARLLGAYRDNWPTLHATTRKRLDGLALRLDSFHAGDGVEWAASLPEDIGLLSFPPFWCLAPEQRILTADLRWVPCGDLMEGQEILAFDEYPASGQRMRRWRYATVMHSEPAVKECVRVHLENGESIICSSDHPWLTAGWNGGWVAARDLARPSKQATRDPDGFHHHVIRPVDTWDQATSFDDGWLSGILDGEGTVKPASGTGHGSASIQIAQVPGPLIDHAVEILHSRGFAVSVYEHNHGTRYGHQPQVRVEVLGGFPQIIKALGTFQPRRLIDRLRNNTDIGRNSIRVNNGAPAIIKVVGVEPIGLREIQSISTTTRTYIGEGYAMHNTGGYEQLFAKLDLLFDWDRPVYPEMDETRRTLLLESIRGKRHWCLGTRERMAGDWEPSLRGITTTTSRAVPIYLYTSGPASRVTAPLQKTAPVTIPRLEMGQPLGETLSLKVLDSPRFNALRSLYLNPEIAPGAALLPVAVLTGGRLVGVYALSRENGIMAEPHTPPGPYAYLLSDFAIAPTDQAHLSKLVLYAALSRESQLLAERSIGHRVRAIQTTAFSKKPVSMKYRGLLALLKRVDNTEEGGGYMLNYAAAMGQWTIAEGLATWRAKYGGKK